VSPRLGACRRQAGVTLVELMVALVVGLMLTLVVFGVLASFEGRKRTLTSGNDIEQAGQLAMYKLDRWLRSAGAALPQVADSGYGCPLHAVHAGKQLLPRQGTLPAPFDQVDPGEPGVFRLAPVLVLPGSDDATASPARRSDQLVVMFGVPRAGSVAPIASPASAAELRLPYAGDFAPGDLALVVDQPDNDGRRRPCLVTQVAEGFKGAGATLPLAGGYYASTVGEASLEGLTDAALALRLGAGAGSGAPQFLLLGVGDDRVLYSRGLLAADDADNVAQAEGVLEMHALYGVDADADGRIDRWVSPASGDWSVEVLMAGDQLAQTRLAQILAVRIGLVMRSVLPEKKVVTEEPLKLFGDLGSGLAFERPLSEDEKHFRYRTIDQTVPLRNHLL
jgi:type IV pilus assembly protein PilW